VVEANPRYLSTPRLVRWMHARGKPVLGWGLGTGAAGEGSSWLAQRRRRFLLAFDGMLAYSRRGADQYIAQGIPAERVFVALNAVAPRPMSPPPARPPAFTGQPVVLFVGRLQARKRIDVLLHACARMPEELRPRLWVVGDGPARGELQELAKQIYPQAEFPGDQRGADLQPYFAAADLFALPGTGGLAVQEAMTAGLPVIVAEGDGTQDDLVRPDNGWQVPPGDVQALAAVLQQALSDPARLRRMGAESYRLAIEEVNIEAMVSVFVRALNRVTAGSLPTA
jgi:glycosyltransferase involved in cell wall biosynthesis